MKRLFTVLLCSIVVATSFACGEDKGKATKQAQNKTPTQAQSKAPTQAKKKQQERKRTTVASAKRQPHQDRAGECNKQANLKNLKGEDRKRFISSCVG